MTRRLGSAWVAALTLCVGLAAHADNAAVRKELMVRYDQFTAAFKQKSVAKIMAITTPDFTMKMPNGQVFDAKKSEALLKQNMAMVKSISKASTRIDKLTVNQKADKAVCDVTETLSATMMGQDQKPHVLASTSVSKDTWVKGKKGWLIKTTESISEKNTVDGKPVPGGM